MVRRIGAIVGMLLLLAAGGAEGAQKQLLASYKPKGAPSPTGILQKIEENGALHFLMELRGTHYEMGFAHGYLVAGAISQYYHDYFAKTYFTPERQKRFDGKQILEVLPKAYRQELEGMRDGLDARRAELKAAGQPSPEPVTLEGLLALQCEVELAGFGCTAVASFGPRTFKGPLSGKTVISRSADWTDSHPARLFTAMQGTISYKSTEPGDRPLVSISRAGLVGVHTGMNDTGFYIEMNYAPIVPITRQAFYPSLVYQREALERIDGARKTFQEIRAQLDPILTHKYVVKTIQPMIAWVPAGAGERGGVAVVEGIGSPAGPIYRRTGWNDPHPVAADGNPRVRLSWASKTRVDGKKIVLATDGSFLGECSEIAAGQFEIVDRTAGNAKLFTFSSSDIVAKEKAPEVWVSVKARGEGGRFAGKTWWLDNSPRGHFGVKDDVGKFIGVGKIPPGAFAGVCAFELTTSGKLGTKGYWISSDPANDACGRAETRAHTTGTRDGVYFEKGELRYSDLAGSKWYSGTYERFGNIAIFGEYHDEAGAAAGGWFCYGSPNDPGMLVNVNSWFLPESAVHTNADQDCSGGTHGAYRMHRAFANFGGKRDYDPASHHRTFIDMYRNNILAGAAEKLEPSGSICVVTCVPEERSFLVSYSAMETTSGTGPRVALAATSTRVSPIAFGWEDFFSGDTALASAAPAPVATGAAPAGPTPEQPRPQGTGGASNPTLGQP